MSDARTEAMDAVMAAVDALGLAYFKMGRRTLNWAEGAPDRAAVWNAVLRLVETELEAVATGVSQCHRSKTIDDRLAELRAQREGATTPAW